MLLSIGASLAVAADPIAAGVTGQTAGTQVLPAQTTSEMPTPEYQALMRSAASITLKASPNKPDYDAIAQDAQSLQEIFARVETY
jgi:hypothetical protein